MYYLSYEPQKNQDRLNVQIDFSDGKSYVLAFVNADYIKKEIKRHGCVSIAGLIPIDEVSMKRVKELIGYIVNSGVFDGLAPVSEGQ